MSLSILQISTNNLNGGAERVASLLFEAYRSRGHSSRLAVGHRRGSDPDVVLLSNDRDQNLLQKGMWKVASHLFPYVGKLRGAGWFYLWLQRIAQPSNLMEWYRGYEEFNFPGIWHLIKTLKADVVHAHNLHGYYFDLRALPLLSRRAPLMMTLHDAWLLSGHCAYSLGCERWVVGCGNCPDLSIPIAARRDATDDNWHRKQKIFSQTRLYIATPSQWLMNVAHQSMLKPAIAGHIVIPNGVPTSIFSSFGRDSARDALSIPPDAKVVMFMADGRKKAWKDYDTMRAAVLRIASHSLTSKLIVLGVGQSLPAERIGENEIRFLPYQRDMRALAQCYQSADVYIHAAFEDNFPNTILESLACGTPVVATAVGGIPEQVDDGETGYLVPKGDSELMAKRVVDLLQDDARCQSLSLRAASVARRRFDLNQQVDNYLKWYGDARQDWLNWQRSQH